MGVVIESAYRLLGSPECTALVDRDLPPVSFFFGVVRLVIGRPLSARSDSLRPGL